MTDDRDESDPGWDVERDAEAPAAAAPQAIECPRCYGDGRIRPHGDGPSEVCPCCKGTGEIPAS